MQSLYIHIPYCRRKCFYCDFYSQGAKNAPWEQLASAIYNELLSRRGELAEPPATIYIGGGTPSAMPLPVMSRLVENILCAVGTQNLHELTVEVNPENVSKQLVDTYLALGVNRVSMGVQSFDDRELAAVGRAHSSGQALRAYELLARVPNVSIDLMFGLPGQSLQSWQMSVEEAMNLHPQHISAYSLMWEDGTPLSVMRKQGRIPPLPEALCVDMYHLLREKLLSAGYTHYETSNYALPGYESRHNQGYWRFTPYLGLGPSAHSYDGLRIRRANPPLSSQYIRHFSEPNPSPFYTEEILTDTELLEEHIMLRLRTASGINLSDFAAKFGSAALATLLKKAAPSISQGHLAKKSERLYIPSENALLLDTIILSLL